MTHAIHVRHMRIRTSAKGNAVALRLGVEQGLKQARVFAAALPSSAILVIRQLQVDASFQLAAPAAREWSEEVAARIRTYAQRAIRPAHEYIPHDADSVLFWDAVELLTCYTNDMLVGHNRWYWHNLFGVPSMASVGERLITGWQAYPTAIPKMMTSLAVRHAQHAIMQLGPRDLSIIVRLLHNEFVLPDMVFSAQVAAPAVGVRSPETVSAPWQSWLPAEATNTLSPPAAYLLGLCYTLVRQPQQARSTDFARRAVRWLEIASVGPTHIDEPENTSDHPALRTAVHREQPISFDALQHTSHQESQVFASQARAEPLATVESDPVATESDVTDQTSARDAHVPQGIKTALGGVFYLVNMVEWVLSVVDPDGIDDVNRWELVAALAHDLLSDAAARYQDDAIWPLLRDLAQIDPHARLGEALPVPGYFCIDPAWLAQHGLDVVSCQVGRAQGNGRLRMWADDVGILVADVPDHDQASNALVARFEAAQIALDVRPGETAATDWHVPTADQGITPGLAWWLACIRPLVDWRIKRASSDPVVVWHDRLAAPALIQVTHTHIDVHLALDQIDMDIRRVGLDVDPGWQPAFGYIVYFHFD